jgi:hypothetical protein
MVVRQHRNPQQLEDDVKPYTPPTNCGRDRAIDEIHHRTADIPRAGSKKSAKVARHGARQAGQKDVREAFAFAY